MFRNCDLGYLEDDIAAVTDDFRANVCFGEPSALARMTLLGANRTSSSGVLGPPSAEAGPRRFHNRTSANLREQAGNRCLARVRQMNVSDPTRTFGASARWDIAAALGCGSIRLAFQRKSVLDRPSRRPKQTTVAIRSEHSHSGPAGQAAARLPVRKPNRLRRLRLQGRTPCGEPSASP